MNRPAFEVILAAPANRDFIDVMDWSTEHFGTAAADPYETLIGQALNDLAEDPFRQGARQRPSCHRVLTPIIWREAAIASWVLA